jgi:hypothetical protein
VSDAARSRLLLGALGMLVAALAFGSLSASAAAPLPRSAVYVGRGEDIKRISFHLVGHKLVEADMVVIEKCETTGHGHARHYRWRAKPSEASPRWPLKVDASGRFREGRRDVWFAGDESREFVGTVTPREIVGSYFDESTESPPESGVFSTCQTGPFPPRQARKLSFHAARRLGGAG